MASAKLSAAPAPAPPLPRRRVPQDTLFACPQGGHQQDAAAPVIPFSHVIRACPGVPWLCFRKGLDWLAAALLPCDFENPEKKMF